MELSITGRTLHRKEEGDYGLRDSFAADCIFCDVEDREIFEIVSIYVDPDHRGRGLGSMLVNSVVEQNSDKIILYTAGLLVREYPEEPGTKETQNILANLSNFVTKLDFVSVNHIVDYDSKVAFVYNNEAARTLLEKWDCLPVNSKKGDL